MWTWILFIAAVVAMVGLARWYASALESRLRMRNFTTSVEPAKLRELFDQNVANLGWKIVERGNPRVAESPLVTGRRQRIHLRIGKVGDDVWNVEVGPTRVILGGPVLQVPIKSHTLNLRLRSFVAAVRTEDPSITVTRTPRPRPSGSTSWL